MPAPSSTHAAGLWYDVGRRRLLAAGEVIFREGDASTRVYVVVSGRVRMLVSAGGGREVVLDVKRSGEVFGELAAIDGGGRSATAIAAEASEVTEIAGDDYLAAVLVDPVLAREAMRSLARQVRRASARVAADATDLLVTRTARTLLDLAEAGSDRDRHWVVATTQADLAEWLGATREATSRALATMRHAGVIATGRSRVTVLDRRALAAWARPT